MAQLAQTVHSRSSRDRRDRARTILISAQDADVAVPRDHDRKFRFHDDTSEKSEPDDHTILREAEKITDHVGRVVFPAFSLDRGEGCEIHENAYWDL